MDERKTLIPLRMKQVKKKREMKDELRKKKKKSSEGRGKGLRWYSG